MQSQRPRYNLRYSTKMKSLVSKLRITEAQAQALYSSIGDMLVRPSQNRVTHDFEICWYGRWAKAELKVPSNTVYIPLGGLIRDRPDMLRMNDIYNVL